MKLTSIFLAGMVFIFSACNDSEFSAEEKPKTYEERYKEIEAKIRNTPEWLAAVEQKAKERNISLDSMIKLDVTWTIDEQDGKHQQPVQPTNDSAAKKPYNERVKDIVQKIRNDKDWLATIQKKADDRKISLDSMLLLDARWMVDEEDGKHK